jgi:hypothetical protein
MVSVGIICLGYALFSVPQNRAYDTVNGQLALVTARIGDDNAYIASFKQREARDRAKMATINALDLTASGDLVQARFERAVHGVVTRDKLGVRPFTFAAAWTPDGAPRGGPAAPAPGNGSAPGGTQAPARPGAGAPAPGVAGAPNPPSVSPAAALAGNIEASSAPTVPGAAAGVPGGAVAPDVAASQQRVAPQMMKNTSSLELVGPYATVLHAISELSTLPLLLEVTDATLTRDTNDGSPNPPIDLKLSVTLYRVEATPTPAPTPAPRATP